jgi:hypothetical protein
MDKPELSPGEHVIKRSAIGDYEEAKRIRQHLADNPCPHCTPPQGDRATPHPHTPPPTPHAQS